jgi:hypothetical protein
LINENSCQSRCHQIQVEVTELSSWAGPVIGQVSRTNWLPQIRPTFVLAALGLLLFLEARAQASCGHYVQTVEHSSAAAPPMGATPRLEGEPSPSTPIKPHVPCSGPNCSSAPQREPLAPVKVQISGVEKWTELSARTNPDRTDSTLLLTLAICARPSHCSFSPDPPPRSHS